MLKLASSVQVSSEDEAAVPVDRPIMCQVSSVLLILKYENCAFYYIVGFVLLNMLN